MTRTTDQPKLDLDRILRGEPPAPDEARPSPRQAARRLGKRKTARKGGGAGKGCCGRGLGA